MATRRILVTGGAGYIGARLIRDLAAAKGFAVRVLDNLQREGYQALMGIGAAVEFVEGDLLDPTAVRRALDGTDTVIHLAGIVSTPLSFEHPRWTDQINHWGTTRLVESALDAGVDRFIFASSYSVYGPGEGLDERTECRPVGPYASSKLAAERAVSAGTDRGFVSTVLRIGTVFGHGPIVRFDALPNRFAYLAGTGRPLTVYGDGKQKRPFVHLDDAAAAVRFCLERPEETAGGTFNIVSRNATVNDVVAFVKAAKPDVRVRFTDQDVRTHLSFDIVGERIRELGWRPTRTLEDGMEEIIVRFSGVSSPGMYGSSDTAGALGLENGDF